MKNKHGETNSVAPNQDLKTELMHQFWHLICTYQGGKEMQWMTFGDKGLSLLWCPQG